MIMKLLKYFFHENKRREFKKKQEDCPHKNKHEAYSRYGEDDYGYTITCNDCGKLLDED